MPSTIVENSLLRFDHGLARCVVDTTDGWYALPPSNGPLLHVGAVGVVHTSKFPPKLIVVPQ